MQYRIRRNILLVLIAQMTVLIGMNEKDFGKQKDLRYFPADQSVELEQVVVDYGSSPSQEGVFSRGVSLDENFNNDPVAQDLADIEAGMTSQELSKSLSIQKIAWLYKTRFNISKHSLSETDFKRIQNNIDTLPEASKLLLRSALKEKEKSSKGKKDTSKEKDINQRLLQILIVSLHEETAIAKQALKVQQEQLESSNEDSKLAQEALALQQEQYGLEVRRAKFFRQTTYMGTVGTVTGYLIAGVSAGFNIWQAYKASQSEEMDDAPRYSYDSSSYSEAISKMIKGMFGIGE